MIKNDVLRHRLEKAAGRVMSPKEAYEQRVSFIWGMQDCSKPGLTREEIKAALHKAGIVDPEPNQGGQND